MSSHKHAKQWPLFSRLIVGSLLAVSALTGFRSATLSPASTRVNADLQALYTFEEGSGTTVQDVSGVAAPLDLEISDLAAVHWLPGSLSVDSRTLISSAGAATKIIDASRISNEITLEVWVKPNNTAQDGPARILTLSSDTLNRNFTIGQGRWGNQPSDLYDVRLRTTKTDANGRPSLSTSGASLTIQLTHVIYTRDASGVARIYLNGVQRASGVVLGDLSNWGTDFPLALANELTGDRPWLGVLYLVAVYDRALSQDEVSQNFDAGPESGATPTPTAMSSLTPTPTSITSTAAPTQTPTETQPPQPTDTPAPSLTPTPTQPSTAAPTSTPTWTATPSPTDTPSPAPSLTAMPTFTASPANSPTSSPTATFSFTPTSTETSVPAPTPGATSALPWTHLSSAAGELPSPSNGTKQTASLILDIDLDGDNDFVIGIGHQGIPSLVWYRRDSTGWTKYLIDNTPLWIEAGGAFHDVDGDGDLDIVMGGDSRSNQVWWWENPHPDHDPNLPWIRRLVKDSGANKHHDQIFGDFDNDGDVELVFWNQGAQKLYIAEIPNDPRNSQPWFLTEIYSWTGGDHEGLAKADIDGDGQVDLVGGGRWFKHEGGSTYSSNVIDDSQRFTRVAVGQLKEGGRPEVVFVVGDGSGRVNWYEWTGSAWLGHGLLGFDVDHGHSLDLADFNRDGNLDIFVAEMRLNDGNEDAKMWVFLGDGFGNFIQTEVATGLGNHESKVGDLDADGDVDILGKPFNWNTPRVDVWLNDSLPRLPLDSWKRHVVDFEMPWQALFITSADMDGDGLKDIIVGGWWYENPGDPAGSWIRHPFGSPLNNMAAIYDFDGDGDLDVLGTEGQGSESNSNFVWARNDGSGSFSILTNVPAGQGDFLQGAAVGRFQQGGPLEIALSWHQAGMGVQRLIVPLDPSAQIWTWDQISATSQDEALSAGDIDGDGDLDLLLGTMWLRNEGISWTVYTLNDTAGDPDRNLLADINQDGLLDAVVGFEAVSTIGKLAWYEQGSSPTSIWVEHLIGNVIGPMSLDVVDMDGDGDLDIIAGEHNKADPSSAKLYIFENADGNGDSWVEHIVFLGDEHHDGAQIVDIDGDGDKDILSIGFTHNRVLLYENKAIDSTPTPLATVTATSTVTETPTQTPTNTPVPVPTPTPSPTVTLTPQPTSSPTPTLDMTPTQSPTPLQTPTFTAAPTSTQTATSTPPPTPTPGFSPHPDSHSNALSDFSPYRSSKLRPFGALHLRGGNWRLGA